jgi:hypothetical protein
MTIQPLQLGAPCAKVAPNPTEGMMVALDNLVQFSIPVSDVPASMRFYTEIVGLKHLRTVAHGMMAFVDAAGVCVMLVCARSVRAQRICYRRISSLTPLPARNGRSCRFLRTTAFGGLC